MSPNRAPPSVDLIYRVAFLARRRRPASALGAPNSLRLHATSLDSPCVSTKVRR